jgi:hypothetical protein
VQPYPTDSATPNRQLKRLDLPKLADSLTTNRPADPSVFFIFSNRTFLVQFFAAPHLAHLVLPNTQADPSQNQKSHFCQRTVTTMTINPYICTAK